VSVGGLIILTNSRTLALEAGVPAEARQLLYFGIVTLWVALVVAALKRRGHDAAAAWTEPDRHGEYERHERVSVPVQ
jgi:hypothetical protein